MAEQQIDKIYIDIQVKNTGLNILKSATDDLVKIATNINAGGINIYPTLQTQAGIKTLATLYNQLSNIQRLVAKPMVLDFRVKSSSGQIKRGGAGGRGSNGNQEISIKDIAGNTIQEINKTVDEFGSSTVISDQFGINLKRIDETITDSGKYYKEITDYTKNLNDELTRSTYALDENGKKWLKQQTTIQQTREGLTKTTKTYNQLGEEINKVIEFTDRFGNTITGQSAKSKQGNARTTVLDNYGKKISETAKEIDEYGNTITKTTNAFGQTDRVVKEFVDNKTGEKFKEISKNNVDLQNGITRSTYALDENGKKWLQTQTAIKQTRAGLEKVTTTFDKTGKTISTVTQTTDRFGNVVKTMPENLNKSRTSLSSFANGLTSAAAKLTILGYGLSQVSQWFSTFINESNSYIENLNLFRVTFGNMTDEAERFVETYSEALGLDPSQVMRNMGFFNQIVTGFGVSTEEGYQMSKLLTQLAYDLSSFVNIDIDEAMLKFQSGIAGELEPLRRVGYALDEATLQQVAYNHGIDESIRTMTQAEKAYIRLITMYEQSENVMGDLAATINSPANAIRILKQEFTILRRSIGNMIMPLLTKIIPILQGAMRAFTEFFNMLAERFGYEIEGARENAYAEYMDEITASAKEAENAVEGTLLSFDKFSVLGSQDDKEENFTLPIPDYDALATLADSLYETSEAGQKTYEIFRKLLMNEAGNDIAPHLQAIVDLINALWASFSSLWSALWPALKLVLESFITPLINGLVEIVKWLDEVKLLVPIIITMLTFKLFGSLVANIRNMVAWVGKLGRSIKNLKSPIQGILQLTTLATTLVAVFSLTYEVISNWSNMSTAQKIVSVIGILATAFFGLALAVGAFHSAWSLGTAVVGMVAGMALVTGIIAQAKHSASQPVTFATGGFTPLTSGSLFMAGENGRPELMGTVRGKNAVANVNSIEDAMEQASYRGMVSAIAQANRDSSSNTDNTPIILQLDGREIARANVRNTANALSRNYRIELNPR